MVTEGSIREWITAYHNSLMKVNEVGCKLEDKIRGYIDEPVRVTVYPEYIELKFNDGLTRSTIDKLSNFPTRIYGDKILIAMPK